MTLAQEQQLATQEAAARSDAIIALAAEKGLPLSTIITHLTRHGTIASLADADLMAARLRPLFARTNAEIQFRLHNNAEFSSFISAFSANAAAKLEGFFTKLVYDKPYDIPSDLITYIANRQNGKVFTSTSEEANPAPLESPDLPAAFTFVGQFVDHDLTLNAVNLIDPEEDDKVADDASPYIDLDSVYGPRAKLSRFPTSIFDGSKFIHIVTDGVPDLPRYPLRDNTEWINFPAIFDARNDENQMILQVHLLIERLHNKWIDSGAKFETARKNTILNWQSVLVNDYLPRLLAPAVFKQLKDILDAGDFGQLKVANQRADGTWYLRMPHEFSIGFRMGHSQLRPAYTVRAAAAPVPLFDAAMVADSGSFPPTFGDLRGGQRLSPGHQINWSFFLGAQPPLANAIDGKVTSVVFDLPSRTIPDDIKYVANLPQRNLIRSKMLGICGGEDLARYYGLTPLNSDQIESDQNNKALFAQNGTFRTPLWYYLLKEAEVARSTSGPPANPLGPLGSRLVGEVIMSAIRFNDINWWDERGNAASWSITGVPEVTLSDVVGYV